MVALPYQKPTATLAVHLLSHGLSPRMPSLPSVVSQGGESVFVAGSRLMQNAYTTIPLST